jgi:hypothetical protein
MSAMNPPSFTWLHDKRAAHYDIEWSQTRDFAAPVSAKKVPWCVYTHHEPLKPGVWFWRYRFTTAKQEVAAWSAVRSVTVPDSAIPFPMPTRAQQRERLPARHPRSSCARKTCRGCAPPLRRVPPPYVSPHCAKEADALIKKGPDARTRPPRVRPQQEDDEAVKHWWPNRENRRSRQQRGRTARLRVADDPRRALWRGRPLVPDGLGAWDPDGPSNFALNCEAAKAVLYRPLARLRLAL